MKSDIEFWCLKRGKEVRRNKVRFCIQRHCKHLEKTMQDLKERVENVRKELDDLVISLAARAKVNDHHPNFGKKDKCDKASLWCSAANNKLWYALVALGQ